MLNGLEHLLCSLANYFLSIRCDSGDDVRREREGDWKARRRGQLRHGQHQRDSVLPSSLASRRAESFFGPPPTPRPAPPATAAAGSRARAAGSASRPAIPAAGVPYVKSDSTS